MRRFVVGITGASGISLGLKFMRYLAEFGGGEVFLVLSDGAKMVADYEKSDCVKSDFGKRDSGKRDCAKRDSGKKDSGKKDSGKSDSGKKDSSKSDCAKNGDEVLENVSVFSDSALYAPISSGSFGVESTFIIPCSANSLAKIACGISDTLITRAALVALKERKNLLLAPREMPLNSIMLQNMLTLSNLGAIIAPPMLSYYANAENLEAMEDFMCGKWLDCVGIRHNLFPRWGEK